uniref:Uncharacterized protein n=1 Tax=Arundo donax TaxID=35708 RepID=A0A0A8YAX8_ARUDO
MPLPAPPSRQLPSSSATAFASIWVPSGLVTPAASELAKRGKVKVVPRHGNAKTWIRGSWAEGWSCLRNS